MTATNRGPQLKQRIPADIRDKVTGFTLVVPIGRSHTEVTVTPAMERIRVSLRTKDRAEVRARRAAAIAHLEAVWKSLRGEPANLSHRQATALGGEFYRAWADDVRYKERSVSVDVDMKTKEVRRVYTPLPAHVREQAFRRAAEKIVEQLKAGVDLKEAVGAIVDTRLQLKGLASVEPETRQMVREAFAQALVDAFEHRARQQAGDYSPDPKAARFPEWEATEGGLTLSAMLGGWWAEAEKTGRAAGTKSSYAAAVKALRLYLGHDSASLVTTDDLRRFKAHRLATVAATTTTTNLAALKTLFRWAVGAGHLRTNPALGLVGVQAPKRAKVRPKGFTEEEARDLLRAALEYRPASRKETPQATAAKRWVPWLCAYTGARVGEIAQLRREDVREAEPGLWCIRITPEAGPVKTGEVREVPLHPALIPEFPEWATGQPEGYLFLVGGLSDLHSRKTRLAQFARTIVPDRRVAPNHGWRHRFKTVGMACGIEARVLDAIQGHSPRTAAEGYGEVGLKVMAEAVAKMPQVLPTPPPARIDP